MGKSPLACDSAATLFTISGR